MMLLGLMCCLLLVTIAPRVKSIYDLSVRKKVMIQEKERLSQINSEQMRKLEAADSPENIERIAREQLGMVKKGERTIIKVITDK
jgi:cell division protein FtsB